MPHLNQAVKNKHSEGALLRVLSGANVGAEVALTSGSYLVGKGLDCDLILRDEYVSENHLRISVFNGDLHLFRGDAPVYVNGVALAGPSMRLGKYDVIKLGLTTFAVGPVGQQWPSMDPVVAHPALNRPARDTALEHVNPAQIAVSTKRARKSGFGPVGKMLGATGLVLLSLGLFGKTAIKPVEALVETTQAERSVGQTLQLMELQNHVKISKDITDRVEVTGYVLNGSQEFELKERIEDLNANIITRIWNTEDLARAATTVVNAMGATKIRAYPESPGEIRFSGFTRDDNKWNSALAAVKRDVPAIRKIHDEDVQTLDRGERVLREKLSQEGMLTDIQVSLGDMELIATGILKESDMTIWGKVRSTYQSSHEFLPLITDQVRAEQEVKITIPVRSVSIAGDEAYLVTEAGIRYAEGGMLSDGFQIVSILPDHIVVQKDDRSYVYNLGAKDDSRQ